MNPEENIENVVLKTPRLTLRPWRQDDLQDFFEYASDEGVGEMAGWPHHVSLEDSQKVLDRFIDGKRTFAIEIGGKVVGSLGIEKYNEKLFPQLDKLRICEIGYVLSRKYWGHGYMPEAVRAVLKYLFEEMELDAVMCGHFVWNRQSDRVMTKCGFMHMANGKYETVMGTIEDEEQKILFRQDWERYDCGEYGLIGTFFDDLWEYQGIDNLRFTARALAFNDKGELGLLRIVGEDLFGKRDHYETCGGGLEEGEYLSQTVIREVREELGYGVSSARYLGEIIDFYNVIKRETHSHFFYVKLDMQDHKHTQLTEEEAILFKDVIWMEPHKALEELETNVHGKVGRIVQRRDAMALRYLLDKHEDWIRE